MTLLSLTAFAQSEPYAVLSENNTVLTFYYDTHKAERNGMSVTTISWYSHCFTIVTVVFDTTFANCTSLTNTNGWFCNFENLTSITGIENLKTDNVTDMGYMFCGCSSLTSLDVSGFNTDNVTKMDHMFSGCSSLTSLDLSNFNTDNVTDMSDMFIGCSNLTSLDVSGFKTDNVTNMGNMFIGCSGLTTLDVSGFNTAKVIYMNSMFWGCSGLTSLDVSGFKTGNVTHMKEMFLGCSGLTSLDVSGFKTDNVTNMSGMFSNCSGLTSLDVSGFETDKVTDMDGMFYNCRSLTSLDVSGFKTDNVTDMGAMFFVCCSLTSLDVGNFNTVKVTDMSYMFADCKGLTSLDLSKFKTDSVTNMYAMFYDNPSLMSLNVSSFKTDKVTDMSLMFYGCRSLTSLDVSGFKTDNVTNMSAMFRECSSLTSLDVSGFKTDNVTDMSYMFYFCGFLQSLDVSGFKTDKVTDMRCMFAACPLQNLDVSGFKTDNVTSMSGMFFLNCVTSLDLSGFKTDNVTDMSDMFLNCYFLTTIYAGKGWTTANVTNSEEMFSGCWELVGGQGTAFDSDHTDYTYARIDGGTAMPGYFTDIEEMEAGETATVPVGNALVAGYSSDKALDFTGSDVTAWIATGFRDGKIMLSKVDVVPANTGIYVKSTKAGDFDVPTTTEKAYYVNMFQPVVTAKTVQPTETVDGVAYQTLSFALSQTTGQPAFFPNTAEKTYGDNKMYLRLPEWVVNGATGAADSGTEPVTIGTLGVAGFSSNRNLDFTDSDVEAWIATGFKGGNILLSRVYAVPAGTGVYVKSKKPLPAQTTFQIPVTTELPYYVNAFVGLPDGGTVHPTETVGGVTMQTLSFAKSQSTGKPAFFPNTADKTYGAGKMYLRLPADLVNSSDAARGFNFVFEGDEVPIMGETTGISEASPLNDKGQMINGSTGSPQDKRGGVYNLNGQCVQTSNFKVQTSKLKKGLYIVNGKKVVIK